MCSVIQQGDLSEKCFVKSLFSMPINKGYGWRFIQNESAEKGVCRRIIIELNKNQ